MTAMPMTNRMRVEAASMKKSALRCAIAEAARLAMHASTS